MMQVAFLWCNLTFFSDAICAFSDAIYKFSDAIHAFMQFMLLGNSCFLCNLCFLQFMLFLMQFVPFSDAKYFF
jgi:hypothetical protein